MTFGIITVATPISLTDADASVAKTVYARVADTVSQQISN